MNEIPAPAKTKKALYPYQQADLDIIFERIANGDKNHRLLYQLPTGGGKTVVFSEIVRRFTKLYNMKAAVLTHRNELCRQTSKTLTSIGVSNKVITSTVRNIPHPNDFQCYVAMVETLKNRIREKKIAVDDVGLVIIDEAHHNSFRKLLSNFRNAFVIGVTATPLSADPATPMRKDYRELIIGESIPSLIAKGFLAEGITYGYDVELNSLKTGAAGDFTMQSSDDLYTSKAMLDLLLQAYDARAKGKKTLIFNNGIRTSRKVFIIFTDAGYPIRHLDNKTPAAERLEILKWFRKTPGSILTSVSLLTTGFDEPSIEAVILNRATKSLTLYFQMIGRASRRMRGKKKFTIVDLGNNAARFGLWADEVDWKKVFSSPEEYLYNFAVSENTNSYHMPASIRALFPNSSEFAFDVEEYFRKTIAENKKPKWVIQMSIRQHALMCIRNAENVAEARKLAEALEPDINHRVKEYSGLLEKTTKSYRDWLEDDYKNRLSVMIGKIFNKVDSEREKEFNRLI